MFKIQHTCNKFPAVVLPPSTRRVSYKIKFSIPEGVLAVNVPRNEFLYSNTSFYCKYFYNRSVIKLIIMKYRIRKFIDRS